MCIRDRNRDVILAKGQTHYLCNKRADEYMCDPKADPPDALKEGIKPVSYTHLDVYKRQDLPQAKLIASSFAWGLFPARSTKQTKQSAKSVSYTHLAEVHCQFDCRNDWTVWWHCLRPMLRFWRYVRAVNEVRGGTSWKHNGISVIFFLVQHWIFRQGIYSTNTKYFIRQTIGIYNPLDVGL